MASQITFIGSRNSESKDPGFYLAELSRLSLYYFDGVAQPSARRVSQDGEEFRNEVFAIELVERRSRLAYVVSEVVAMMHLLRYSGVDVAAAFNERLIKKMREKRGVREYLRGDLE